LRLLGGAELEGRRRCAFFPSGAFASSPTWRRADWVSRDELAALFWRSHPGSGAQQLRKLLLEVRALALPQLETDRNGVRWQVATDVAEFGTAIAQGDLEAAARCIAAAAAARPRRRRERSVASGSPASACACTRRGAMLVAALPPRCRRRAGARPAAARRRSVRRGRDRRRPTRSMRSATGAARPKRSAPMPND
jgi:hypothetical protein